MIQLLITIKPRRLETSKAELKKGNLTEQKQAWHEKKLFSPTFLNCPLTTTVFLVGV